MRVGDLGRLLKRCWVNSLVEPFDEIALLERDFSLLTRRCVVCNSNREEMTEYAVCDVVVKRSRGAETDLFRDSTKSIVQ